MKKLTKVLLLAFLAILSLAVACKNDAPTIHEHTYATTYTTDENYHWYKSTCGHDEEVKDKAEHTWGNVVPTVDPTTTTEGKVIKECSTCNRKEEVTIEMLPLYKFDDEYTLDKPYDRLATVLKTEKIINTITSEPIKAEEIVSILYKEKDASDDTYAEDAPMNAGAYVVKVTIKGHELTKDFTISPKVIKGEYRHPADLTYTGDSQPIPDYTLDNSYGVLDGDTVLVKGAKASINAGINVVATEPGLSENPNYELAKDGSYKVLVAIKPKKITTELTVTKFYDATDHLIEYTNWNTVSDVLEKDRDNLKLIVEMDDIAVTTTVDKYEFKPNNYTIAPELIKAEIQPREITLKEKYERPYDGTDSIIITKDKLNGIQGEEDVTLTLKMSGVNGGTNSISECTLTEGSGAATNYFIDKNKLEGLVSIVAKKLEGKLTKSFEYDGKDGRIIPGAELTMFTGLIGEDNISDYHLIVQFEKKDAGSPISYLRLVKGSSSIADNNYFIDEADVTLSIIARVLRAKKVPQKEYDGFNFIELEAADIEGLLPSSTELQPIFKVYMSSANATATYSRHEISYTHGGPVTNYAIDPNDPNALKAKINKIKLNFPGGVTKIAPTTANTGYREFYLGSSHGVKDNKTIQVHVENYNTDWTYNQTINLTDCRAVISQPNDSTNYELVVPSSGTLKILPSNAASTSISINSTVPFKVTNKTDVYCFLTTYHENGVEYSVQVINKDKNQAVKMTKNNIVISLGSTGLVVPYTEYFDDEVIFKANGSSNKGGEIRLQGLQPGNYTITVSKNK